eukprot:12912246-Prorocentrum_lima.AAC.1
MPSVIQVGLAAVHAKESAWLQRDSDLRRDGVAETFTTEVIPMVLAVALRDKRVWSEDLLEF